jgi:hypothetical protein
MRKNERASQDAARHCTLWNRRFLQVIVGCSVLGMAQPLGVGAAAVATLAPELEAQAPGKDPIGRAIKLAALELPPAIPLETIEQSLIDAIPILAEPSLIRSMFEAAFPDPNDAVSSTASLARADEMVSFGTRTVPRWLVDTILKAARHAGVDPVYLMALADVESSLSFRAKAPTSSAEGLFQFIEQTWLEMVHAHAAQYGFTAVADAVSIVDGVVTVVDEKTRGWVLGLRQDPYFSALMASELVKDVQRALQSEGERELAEAELYLAHFFGASSAVTFLRTLDEDPDTVAARLFPKAAKANRTLFTDKEGRKRRSITVAEFFEKINQKITGRIDRYVRVAPVPAPTIVLPSPTIAVPEKPPSAPSVPVAGITQEIMTH